MSTNSLGELSHPKKSSEKLSEKLSRRDLRRNFIWKLTHQKVPGKLSRGLSVSDVDLDLLLGKRLGETQDREPLWPV